jgi:hypothetical protein
MMELPEMAANEPLVRDIMEHLIAAFNDFVDNYDGDIDYVDGFMAAHNFHVYLILDLENKKELDHEQKLFLRKVAIDTFRQGLERRP